MTTIASSVNGRRARTERNAPRNESIDSVSRRELRVGQVDRKKDSAARDEITPVIAHGAHDRAHAKILASARIGKMLS